MKKPAPRNSQAPLYRGPLRDLALLPERVAAMREKILEACESGEIEALRPAIERNETLPLLGESGDRPKTFASAIEFLRKRSFDGGGREILLLLENALNAPFVHARAGMHESWVWPAHGLVPVDRAQEPLPAEWLGCISFADFLAAKNAAMTRIQRVTIGQGGTWHAFGPDRSQP